MAELKPCPFCGRTPRIEDCGEYGYFVTCDCGIEQSKLYCQKCDAVRHWNRRKDEQTDVPVITEADWKRIKAAYPESAMILIDDEGNVFKLQEREGE